MLLAGHDLGEPGHPNEGIGALDSRGGISVELVAGALALSVDDRLGRGIGFAAHLMYHHGGTHYKSFDASGHTGKSANSRPQPVSRILPVERQLPDEQGVPLSPLWFAAGPFSRGRSPRLP